MMNPEFEEWHIKVGDELAEHERQIFVQRIWLAYDREPTVQEVEEFEYRLLNPEVEE